MSEAEIDRIIARLEHGFDNVYEKIDGVVAELRRCQDERNKFHQTMIPQYDNHLCQERRRQSFMGKIMVGVITSVILSFGGALWYIIVELSSKV